MKNSFFVVFVIASGIFLSNVTYATTTRNIYSGIPKKQSTEKFSALLHDKNVVIQRIVSNGQVTPIDQPYNQKQDEWVIVLQGHAKLKIHGKGVVMLNTGDYCFIPKHTKHWVIYTSEKPKVIWLTVHIFDDPIPKNDNPD